MSKLQLKCRATLSILKGAYLQFQNKYKESLECYRQALLLYSFEDTVSAVNIWIDDNYIKPSIQQLLKQIESNFLQFMNTQGC